MSTGLRWPRSAIAALVVAGALVLSACSGSPSGSGAPATSTRPSPATGSHILISNFMFQPMSLSVRAGTTVSVTNMDSAVHTVSATGGQFHTGDIGPGATKTITVPIRPGTYHYICDIHQFMVGTITVR